MVFLPIFREWMRIYRGGCGAKTIMPLPVWPRRRKGNNAPLSKRARILCAGRCMKRLRQNVVPGWTACCTRLNICRRRFGTVPPDKQPLFLNRIICKIKTETQKQAKRQYNFFKRKMGMSAIQRFHLQIKFLRENIDGHAE